MNEEVKNLWMDLEGPLSLLEAATEALFHMASNSPREVSDDAMAWVAGEVMRHAQDANAAWHELHKAAQS